MIGVNLITICSMCFMCLCNINVRFTNIFLKIKLILHLLMFCRIRRRIKQSEGNNQVKRKWLSCNSLLLQGEGKASPWREGFAVARRLAKEKKRLHSREAHASKEEASGSPRRRRLCLNEDLHRGEHILFRGEWRIDHKTTLGFSIAKKTSPRRRTLGWSSRLRIFSLSLAHFPLPISISI